MQTDLEQQHEDSELSETSDDGARRVDEPQNGRAEDNAGNQLPDDCRLTEPLGHNTECLRHREHGNEGQKKLRK